MNIFIFLIYQSNMYFIITDKHDNHGNRNSLYKLKPGLNIGKFKVYVDLNLISINSNDTYIRILILPKNAKKIKELFSDRNSKMYDKIIVSSDRYHLYDYKSIIRFNLDFFWKEPGYYNNNRYITHAISKGYIYILDFLRKDPSIYSRDGILNIAHDASVSNRVDVLEWYKNSGLSFRYFGCELDSASALGHIDVLNWWKNSGLNLMYSHKAIDGASRNGYINVLDWWKNSGLSLEYTQDALNYASELDRIDVLDWWKNSGLPLKYSSDVVLRKATENDHINVLEWWKNSGLEMIYYMDYAFCDENVLNWWLNSKLPIRIRRRLSERCNEMIKVDPL